MIRKKGTLNSKSVQKRLAIQKRAIQEASSIGVILDRVAALERLLEDLAKRLAALEVQPVRMPVVPPVPETRPCKPFKPGTVWEHSPTCEIVVAQRGWMSMNPPRCTCGLVYVHTTDH